MLHPFHYHSLVFIIFISPLCIIAQNTSHITVGSSITAAQNSNPWLSPSGDFAFGFQPLPNNTDLFILSIWFNKIPDRTIVWFERTSYPVPHGSTLRLDTSLGLLLSNSSGGQLWSSNNGTIDDDVAHGNMNDTGNFILSGSNSAWLWQSFSHPSDTILPTQTIDIGGMLFSRKTEFNFSEGRFYAEMNEDGMFQWYTKMNPSAEYIDSQYNVSEIADRNASNLGYQLSFSERGIVSIVTRNGTQKISDLTPLQSNPPASESYYRLTLNFDGVLTQYYHPKSFSGNPGWIPLISWPDNICVRVRGSSGSGACGYNNICTLVNQRPVCNCAPGYTLVDPYNPNGECLPDLDPKCVAGDNSSAFEMRQLTDTNWPIGSYESVNPISGDDCKNSCLNDCLCTAAIYSIGSSKCWKKKLPLANGRVDTTDNTTTYLKLRRDGVPERHPDCLTLNKQRRSQKTFIPIPSVLLGSSMFFNVLLLAAGCLGFFLIKKKNKLIPNLVHSTVRANLRCFSFKELLQATNGFKEELGRGAFGVVFKATIADCSKSIVAVKKLDSLRRNSELKLTQSVLHITKIWFACLDFAMRGQIAC